VRHIRELFDLSGKVALVTGAAGGYGVPITRGLAQAGAHVVVASRDVGKCAQFVEELRSEQLSAEVETFDMGEPVSIEALAARIRMRHNGLDFLVNNAVQRPRATHYDEQSQAEWEQSLRINGVGLHCCTKAFAGDMAARGGGAIINIGSIYGVLAPDFRLYEGEDFSSPADYAFHKGGMVMYTKYCATYYASKNIRVNCISPGGFGGDPGTPFVQRYNARVPLGRMAAEEDIAGVVVFLASNAAAYITGVNLMVDGGLSAW